MKIHANARTCPKSRRLLVKRIEEELVADGGGRGRRHQRAIGRQVAGPLASEGEAGLLDRSSAPKRVPSRLPADRLEAIEALRRLRMTAAEIAEVLAWRSRRSRGGWRGSASAREVAWSRPSRRTAMSESALAS